MNKKNLLWVVLLTAGFLVHGPSMAAQSESPVPCNELAEPVSLVYGDHTTGCDINTVTDIDGFNFDGVDGDVIRISLRANGTLDGRVELIGPSGPIIDVSCQSTVNGCSRDSEVTLTETGAYGIVISDSGSDTTGSYTLQLERFPPLAPQPIASSDPALTDTISPTTDKDFYAFEGDAGNTVRVVVRAFGTLDGRLEIRDPSGVVLIDTACQSTVNGCTVTTDQPLPVDGTYLIAVSDSGIDNSSDYEINIQCLFGPCPGATRPECDIQLNQATFVDGETVTVDVFRYANATAVPVALEWKVWLGVPGFSPIEVINLGADSSFVLPAGTDVDLGPFPLLPVTAALPRGGYEFSCRFLDPVTGRQLMEDRNLFELQ